MEEPPSPPASVSAELTAENVEAEVVLEGAMLKLSRNRQWLERYFVFTSNQILSYYHHKGESKPRACFQITRDCEISDLFVDERQKGGTRETLYCFTISFMDDSKSASNYKQQLMNESFVVRDDNSIIVNGQPHSGAPASPNIRSEKMNSSFSFLKSPLRRRKVLDDAPQSGPQQVNPAVHKQSEKNSEYVPLSAESSLASDSNKNHRRSKTWFRKEKDSLDTESANSKKNGIPKPQLGRRHTETEVPSIVSMEVVGPPPLVAETHTIHESDGSEHKEQEGSEIELEEIEVGQEGTIQNRPRSTTDSGVEYRPSTSQKGSHSVYEEQHAAEQDKLHNEYRFTLEKRRKESRKKIVEGTKLAAAVGAAAGFGVLTTGVGLAAGLVFLGATAAAGGTAGVAEAGFRLRFSKSSRLTIGTQSYEEARLWKSSLDAYVEEYSIKQSTWGQLFLADGRKTTSALVPHDVELMTARSREGTISPVGEEGFKVPPESGRTNLFLKDRHFFVESSSRWRPLEGAFTSMLGPGTLGLRIFREEKSHSGANSRLTTMAVGDTTCAPLKTQIVLNALPVDAFMCLMSYARITNSASAGQLYPNSGQRASFRVIEKIDDHMDVVHVVCRKLYLFPSWTTARDFVLFRYWRYEPDGSYIVCYESVEHSACPPHPDYVRGEMHQVCTIAPSKNVFDVRRRHAASSNGSECLLTSVVQVDPKGWIPIKPLPFLSNQAYAEAFGISALLQLLDIRDAVDFDRFLNVAPDIQQPTQIDRRGLLFSSLQSTKNLVDSGALDSGVAQETMNYDFMYANRERCDSMTFDTVSGIESNPRPLDLEKWAEPDANSFLVRGPSYKHDKVKINAGRSIGRLIAVDVVQVDKPIYSGMSTHPTERIQLALQREKKLLASGKKSDMPPFVFVVNIMLPGPPFYHGVFYYAVDDLSTIDGSDGTGSSLLCKEFLFGSSDSFRDRTFKLIPQIVQGNFMVRKAVGSTPAIMGTKLKQTYVRTNRFMEVLLDCGSSPVATGVIRLSLGYAKTLAIDMGFLLEGDVDERLPERIFGCVRMKFPEFGPHLRKVEPL